MSRQQPPPTGGVPAHRDALEREAARLRWELARLRSRRSVRAAMLLAAGGEGRRGGPAEVLATLRGRRVVADLDVIAPATVRRRMPYPHIDVAHLGAAPPFAAAAPHRRIDPSDVDALQRQPPDLVVLDDLAALARWPEASRRSLRTALTGAGAVVAEVGDDADAAEAARWRLDLVASAATVSGPAGVPALEVPPGVDPGVDNPIGWRREPGTPAVAVGPADDLTRELPHVDLDAATDAGAAVVADPAGAAGSARVLALVARGIPVVVPERAQMAEGLAALVIRAPGDRLADAAAEVGADLEARERHSVRTRRTALRDHGHRARLESVLERLGVPLRPPERISVLLATRRPALLEEAVGQIAAQDHPDVEVVVALHGEGFPDDAEDRVARVAGGRCRVVRVPAERPLGDVCNAALDAATGELIAKMDDDDLYGPGHLSDLVVALGYSGADVVGRRANEVHLADADVTVSQDLDRQERWAHQLPGATLLLPADVLRAVRFRRVPRAVDTHLLRSVHAIGGSAYATHRFGFVRRRHGDHTYQRDVEPGHAGARSGLDRSVLEV